MADQDIPFGGHEMRLNAKRTVGSFGGRRFLSGSLYSNPLFSSLKNKQTNKPPVFFPVPYLYIAYVIFSQANFLISVVFIRFVLYLKKIILSKLCVLFCLVLLNSVLFNLVCFDTTLSVAKYIISISSGFFRLLLDSQVRSGQVRVFNVHLQSKLL